jgi:hypothetical protein
MIMSIIQLQGECEMAKARRYELIAEPTKAVRGQAAVVLEALREVKGTPKLATEINELVVKSGNLKTRQDTLRVTLYYIIVFKGRGLVRATEQELVEAPESVAEGLEAIADEIPSMEPEFDENGLDSVDRAEIALGVE